MIKKSISGILIILILINSTGCASYKQIETDDKNEIEKSREIRLTTVDNKEYQLVNVMVEDSTISGNQWIQNKITERRIKFSFDQIAKIEVEEFHLSTGGAIVLGISVLIFIGWALSGFRTNKPFKWGP